MSLLVIASIAVLVILILTWQWITKALAGTPKPMLCQVQNHTRYQRVHSTALRIPQPKLVSRRHPPFWAA